MARKIQVNIDNCNEFLRFMSDPKNPEGRTAFESLITKADENPTLTFVSGMRHATEQHCAKLPGYVTEAMEMIGAPNPFQLLMTGVMLGTLLARASDRSDFEEILAKAAEFPKNITSIKNAKDWGKQ
jgi:hypothetical protein